MPNSELCPHGGVKRQCRICELEAQAAELQRALEEEQRLKALQNRSLTEQITALKSRALAAEAALERAKRDTVERIIAWLRVSERLTREQGKPRTATTVKDLADALERDLLTALAPPQSESEKKGEGNG